MKDLIERLEAAESGSRKLDAEIFCAALHPDKKPTRNFMYTNREEWGVFVTNQPKPGTTFHDAPHYTTSIDAALTLVPEGWQWLLDGAGLATVFDKENRQAFEGRAATPALALVIAALRAMEADTQFALNAKKVIEAETG